MANLFNSVRGLHPRKNAFNKSYRNTFTANMGQLIPVYLQDCVPGTTIRVGASGLIRFQALLAPLMDNVNCYVHFWKIPYRLLDPQFPRWIGNEIEDSEYNPAYIIGADLFDYVDGEDWLPALQPGGLLDFLGYPTELWKNVSLKVNVRPIQAYLLLIRSWYMNENFVDDQFLQNLNGFLSAHGNVTALFAGILEDLYYSGAGANCLWNHAWSKDYFTSALPNVQSGDPVSLSFAGNASVTVPAQDIAIGPKNSSIQINASIDGVSSEGSRLVSVKNSAAGIPGMLTGPLQVSKDNSNSVNVDRISGRTVSPLNGTADLSEVSAVTINELRVANALQVFKERLMRYGHRYIEYLKGFFNVTSSDARLQIPEWLGGGKMPINIADVEQTSSTSNTPQGNLAGKATGFAGGFAGFKTYCEEECLIIGLAYVQPKASYCQGVSRFLTKLNDRYDYFNPSFEHLGEQEIMSYELHAAADPNRVFGYTPRYAEYRFHNDETHGQFKTTLNYWTLTRIFDSVPGLNSSFIYTQPEALRRVFAVDNVGGVIPDNLLCDFHFNVKVVQPVSKYGTPMLLS